MNFKKILGDLLKALLTKLPLSLIQKLADGKLTREELQALIHEVTLVAAGVFVEYYTEGDDELDLDKLIEEDEELGEV